MAKVLDIDFRKGTLFDSVSKTAGTLTIGNGGFKNTENGMALYFDGSASIYTLLNPITLSKDNATLIIWFKSYDPTELLSYDFIGGGNGGFKYVGLHTSNFLIESNTNGDFWMSKSISVLTSFNKFTWNHLCVNADNGTVNTYLNNELIDTKTPSDNLTFSTIGGSPAPTNFTMGYISKISIWNTADTLICNNDYKKFLNSSLFKKQKVTPINYNLQKDEDLSNDTKTKAAYNYLQGGTLDTDITNNGNNATTTGALLTLNGKKFNGSPDKSVKGNLGNIFGFSCIIKLNSTTEKIIEGAANDKLVFSNSGTLSYTDFDNAYVNGIDTDIITANQWVSLQITSTTAVNFSACTLSLNNATYGNFEIDNIKFHNREWTLQEIKNYHNIYAKQVVLFDDLLYDIADNITQSIILGEEKYIDSGTFKISEDTTSKYIECVTNGTFHYNIDLSAYNGNGYIKSTTGDLSADAGDTVNNSSNFSWANNKLTITMTAGQIVRNLIIQKGALQ